MASDCDHVLLGGLVNVSTHDGHGDDLERARLHVAQLNKELKLARNRVRALRDAARAAEAREHGGYAPTNAVGRDGPGEAPRPTRRPPPELSPKEMEAFREAWRKSLGSAISEEGVRNLLRLGSTLAEISEEQNLARRVEWRMRWTTDRRGEIFPNANPALVTRFHMAGHAFRTACRWSAETPLNRVVSEDADGNVDTFEHGRASATYPWPEVPETSITRRPDTTATPPAARPARNVRTMRNTPVMQEPKDDPFEPKRLIALLESQTGVVTNGREALAALLALVHRVSMYQDEGRSARFAVALRGEGTQFPASTSFRSVEACTFAAIRQLAPLVRAEESCLETSWGQPPGRAGLVIVGVCARPSTPTLRERFKDDEKEVDAAFVVDVAGPGCVSVSSGEFSASYIRDRYETPTAERIIRQALGDDAGAMLASLLQPQHISGGHIELRSGHHVLETAWKKQEARILAAAGDLAADVHVDGLLRLLRAIRDHGHGSILVAERRDERSKKVEDVAKDDKALSPHFQSGRLLRRIPDNSATPCRLGIARYAGWKLVDYMAREWDVRLAAPWGAPTPPGAEDWAREAVGPCLRDAERTWLADARRVAALSQVDGALVVDGLIEAVLVGGKTSVGVDAELPEVWQKAVLHRGSRHRAGAAIAGALKRALVFAVSQDGPVTMFWHHGKEPQAESLIL